MTGSVTENVIKLSFASERMQAAKHAHNFVVDFSSNDLNCRRGVAMTITVSISAIQTQTLDIDADEMLNGLLVFSIQACFKKPPSSSRFTVTLLVFSRADHSTSQVLTTFYVVLSHFLLKACFKSPKLIRPLSDSSTAVTSHAAVNSDARSIQISSRNIRICC